MASIITLTKPPPFLPLTKRSNLYPQIIPSIKKNLTLQKCTCFPHQGDPQFLSLTPSSSSKTHFENTKLDEPQQISIVKPLKTVLWVLFWTSISLTIFAFSKDPKAVALVVGGDSSIKASSFGVKVADFLRSSGWCDEVIVFSLATLPVIELRGAIPVGYWMKLKPVSLTFLSVLGNMVPVPFIILYLKKFATFLAGKNQTASKLMDMLFERAKEKAAPVEEFQWLGLMLFVAVPFPGTGAWTGAIIASVLDMPFWSGLSANFFGVVLAGLLVNLLVNLGLKSAIITGVVLFLVSTFMWSVLRSVRKSLSSNS